MFWFTTRNRGVPGCRPAIPGRSFSLQLEIGVSSPVDSAIAGVLFDLQLEIGGWCSGELDIFGPP